MKSPALSELRRSLAAQNPTAAGKVSPARTAHVAGEEVVDEQTLWTRATQGVTPIRTEDRIPETGLPRDKQVLLQRRAAATGEDRIEGYGISDTAALLNPVASEAVLAFRRTGVQIGQFKKLQDGQIPWRAAVDLHGCTVETARQAVLQLLADAAAESLNVVKIVHGKGYSQETGGSLLKTCVNGWLQQHPGVLAFCSAGARDGGTGAVLVLLKRQSPRADAG